MGWLGALHDKFMRVSDIVIIFMFFSNPGPFWVPSSLDVHVALAVLLTLQSRCIQKILGGHDSTVQLHTKKMTMQNQNIQNSRRHM